MTKLLNNTIAGISLKGGRNDNFYFSLLQYFPESKRWFLHSLLNINDEEDVTKQDSILVWLDKFNVNQLIFDFPITSPACNNCKLDCPGYSKCVDPNIVNIKEKINNILIEDQQKIESSPKDYEYKRTNNNSKLQNIILSKSFKRKLKKEFLPFWNRPIDFWIWNNYYEELMNIFNYCYDSFGHSSLMLQYKFNYLKKHFTERLKLYESNIYIILIELLNAKIIEKFDIDNLRSIDFNIQARYKILQQIEKHLNIFVYESDLEILLKNSRAFESFLLSIAGQQLLIKNIKELPRWSLNQDANFIIPSF